MSFISKIKKYANEMIEKTLPKHSLLTGTGFPILEKVADKVYYKALSTVFTPTGAWLITHAPVFQPKAPEPINYNFPLPLESGYRYFGDTISGGREYWFRIGFDMILQQRQRWTFDGPYGTYTTEHFNINGLTHSETIVATPCYIDEYEVKVGLQVYLWYWDIFYGDKSGYVAVSSVGWDKVLSPTFNPFTISLGVGLVLNSNDPLDFYKPLLFRYMYDESISCTYPESLTGETIVFETEFDGPYPVFYRYLLVDSLELPTFLVETDDREATLHVLSHVPLFDKQIGYSFHPEPWHPLFGNMDAPSWY
jgi:hypothetical protein